MSKSKLMAPVKWVTKQELKKLYPRESNLPTCENCGEQFVSGKGLLVHRNHCKEETSK